MPTPDERRWIEGWRDAGTFLDQQRRRELRELTPARALILADALLSMPWPEEVLARRRATSGLFEQQALFHSRPR